MVLCAVAWGPRCIGLLEKEFWTLGMGLSPYHSPHQSAMCDLFSKPDSNAQVGHVSFLKMMSTSAMQRLNSPQLQAAGVLCVMMFDDSWSVFLAVCLQQSQ